MKRPLLEESNEIHPVLDFNGNNFYAGFWLDCVVKGKDNEDDVKKILFIKTKDGLTALDELKGFKKGKVCQFKMRITPHLLTDNQKSIERLSDIDQEVMSLGFNIPTFWIQTAFDVIKHIFKKYMDFSEGETHDFMAVWTIGTYFHQLFNAYPYLHIHGLSNTGKTRILDLEKLMAFNAIAAGNMTDSPLFRLIESIRPTLLIDETDALADKKNRPAFHGLLLSGYKKFGEAWRTEKETTTSFVPQSFENFSPKALANIDGLEAVLSSRAIKITTWRSSSEKYSTEIVDNSEFKLARDCLYLSLFNEWVKIRDAYKTLQKEDGMINRDWELWKPILTISSLLGEKTHNRIKTFALKRIKEAQDMMNTESNEYKLVKALFRIATSEQWYNVSDIKMAWTNEFEEGEGGWLTSHHTVKVMERLGFKEIRGYMGRKQFRITKDFVDELVKRLNINIADIQPLVDKIIPKPNEKIIEFIRTKNSVSFRELEDYFIPQGMSETDLEKHVEKLSREGLILEKTPGRFCKI